MTFPIAHHSDQLLQFIKENKECRVDKNLSHIHLSKKDLVVLPEWFGYIGTKNVDDEDGDTQYIIREIWLDNNQLTSLPDTIGNLQHLHELWLDDNQLTSLPHTVPNLQSLEALSLSYNKFTLLPPILFANRNFQSLQRLYLYKNQLTSVPHTIGNLQSLLTLSLQDNQLTSVPHTIGNLQNLQRLYLHNNQLTSLNPNLFANGNLQRLEKLSLEYNQLTSLPETIGNLQSLQELWLNNNMLLFLPQSIALLHLSSIDVTNNYIETENLDILAGMNIENRNLFPQKEFIWPMLKGVGSVEELEDEEITDLLGSSMQNWDRKSWINEFNPRHKSKKLLSSIQK